METALEQIRFITTKDEIIRFAEKLTNEVNIGIINPLNLLIQIKMLEKAFDIVKGNIIDEATEEGEKYKKSTYLGAKIDISSVGVSYDYTPCNDEVYNNLVSQKKQLEAVIKARQEMLKTGVNADTGETYPLPIKKGKEQVKITL